MISAPSPTKAAARRRIPSPSPTKPSAVVDEILRTPSPTKAGVRGRIFGSATYILKKDARKAGLTLPVGNEYTCMPDGLTILISHDKKQQLDPQDFRQRLPAGRLGVSVEAVLQFIDKIGYEAIMLVGESKRSMSRLLLDKEENYFIVSELKLSKEEESEFKLIEDEVKPGANNGKLYHASVYLGGPSLLADNQPHSRPLKINDHDRTILNGIHSDDKSLVKKAQEYAKGIFKKLFGGHRASEVRIIYRIVRKDPAATVATATKERPPKKKTKTLKQRKKEQRAALAATTLTETGPPLKKTRKFFEDITNQV